tara:strand:+ start:2173 stop:3621 length:1449 start_codon:yes stop_codon:yes gene_type:complete
MAHELSRLSESLSNQPLMITQSRLDEIFDYIDSRGSAGLIDLAKESRIADKALRETLADEVVTDGSDFGESATIGVLDISGSLTYKPTGFEALCGGTSYTGLIDEASVLCEMEEINTILMQVDSGGGYSYRAFESANEVKAMCQASGTKLIAYIDGISASAAYAWTAVADEVIINPDANVGSIGVVIQLTDSSGKDKKEGVKRQYITSDDTKVPFNEEGGFRSEFLAELQEGVTETYGKFVSHVANNRNLSEETVRSVKAKVYSAEKALELGLVDKIMTGREFTSYLTDISTPKTNQKPSFNAIRLEDPSQTSMEHNMPDNKVEASVDVEMAEKLAQFETMQTQFKAQQELLESLQAEKAANAKLALEADIGDKLASFSFLKEHMSTTISFLSDANVADSHKELLNSILASAQASNELVKEEAAAQVLEATSKAEASDLEKDKIKEEFGTKEIASTEAVVEELTHTQKIEAKVASKKAAKSV